MQHSGFIVLHGNRLEDLRDLTVAFVKAQPLGPLVPELFLVQSNGMKHWLEQALVDGKPWSKTPPAPRVPNAVIERTAAKYQEALTRLTS